MLDPSDFILRYATDVVRVMKDEFVQNGAHMPTVCAAVCDKSKEKEITPSKNLNRKGPASSGFAFQQHSFRVDGISKVVLLAMILIDRKTDEKSSSSQVSRKKITLVE